MKISRQSDAAKAEAPTGPRARTSRLMLDTAIRLMQAGVTPSVTEVAEVAGVSRATAYRYFPSQAALVSAVVDEALGPILSWSSRSSDPERRVTQLIDAGLPRIDAFESTFKAALRLSLDQWASDRAGTLGKEPAFRRGHRVDLLANALSPLEGTIPAQKLNRLAQALSLVFGVEVLTVLKDIWGLDGRQAQSVVKWAAQALVRVAVEEGNSAKQRRS